ncbi:thioredoxin [Allomyces macrogynus ATCC 38327]|uniref:Thioredoxin n=1 Tax=Allomyces macrogynus (strain ATCC 38327) TaxID=578462 RepID=A0A0L0S9H5_ALLM3|nr:thioredoxin [Allomyces macrogynus ATCC 38327]|eukprot:KNE59096.1 thioredoxin [Allomyces macrogynus ATCC 38327]
MPAVTLIASFPDFKRAIAQQKLTVVDWYAVWCGPCKAIAPRYDALAAKYPAAAFYKINVDDLPDVARQCSVSSMPTFHLYKASKLLATVVGANPSELERKIQQHIAPAAFEGTGRVLGSAPKSPTSPGSPTSPTVSSPTASTAASAGPATASAPTATAPAASGTSTSQSTLVWIAFLFLVVYWWMGQKNRVGSLDEYAGL